MTKAILLVSHGSKSPKAKEEILRLVNVLKRESGVETFECAFLESESPNIPDGIENCLKKKVKEVVVLLNFLNSGQHVNEDIPKIIEEAKKKHPHIKFHITKPLAQHPAIIELFLEMLDM